MTAIVAVPLPDEALLNAYQRKGYFTDCYSVHVPFSVSHRALVFCFYTSWLFKLERFLLGVLAARPANDADAQALACGEAETFSAWVVEARAENQLLLSDFRHRTRSWLMVQAMGSETILYFGSAVVPVENPLTGERGMGPLFRALTGFHRLYSVLLLRAAARRLQPCD